MHETKSDGRVYLLYALLVYAAITLIAFQPVAVRFTGAVAGLSDEAYLNLFFLWNSPYSMLVLHESPYFTYSIFYPVGASLPVDSAFPLAGIITFPLQMLNRAAAYNAVFFADYMLAALFMYALAEYLTKNRIAAFASGLAFMLFGFAPIITVGGILGFYSLEFIPLFILFFLRGVREKSAKYALASGVAFVLAAFFGNTEQAPVLILAALVCIIALRFAKGAKFSLRSSVPYAGCAALTSALLCAPFLYYAYSGQGLFQPGVALSDMITIAVAIAAAVGIAYLFKRKVDIAGYAATAAIVLILIAVVTITLQHETITPTTGTEAYRELGRLNSNASIMILPVLPNYTNPDPWSYQYRAMYYQSLATKPLTGGAAASINQSQSFVITSVPLGVEANYLVLQEGLIYSSPITENYSNVTLLLLGAQGTGYVAVQRQAFNYSAQLTLLSYLDSLFGVPVFQDQNTSVFQTSNAIAKSAGRSLVAFPVAGWVPGYSLCTSGCNASFAGTWFGSPLRQITLFAPQGVGEVQMQLQAQTDDGRPVSVYIGSAPIGTLNLTSVLSNFTMDVGVNPGFNHITFLEQGYSSSTGLNSTGTDYGMRNVTFKVVT